MIRWELQRTIYPLFCSWVLHLCCVDRSDLQNREVDFETDYREWLTGRDEIKWLTGLIFFVSAVLLYTFILICSPSSSVSLSYFNLSVPIRKCLGKHSLMSSTFYIDTMYGTCSLGHQYSFVVTCLLSNNQTTTTTEKYVTQYCCSVQQHITSLKV